MRRLVGIVPDPTLPPRSFSNCHPKVIFTKTIILMPYVSATANYVKIPM